MVSRSESKKRGSENIEFGTGALTQSKIWEGSVAKDKDQNQEQDQDLDGPRKDENWIILVIALVKVYDRMK